MIRALYTAADGMIVQERKQATIANNLTNASTTGYKKQDLFVKEMDKALVYKLEKDGDGRISKNPLGRMSFGSEVDDIYINFTQGLITETGKPTDFALEGSGFFQVAWTGNQTAYTRNGSFLTDGEGYLAMDNGSRLLGRNLTSGALEAIQVGGGELALSTDGTLMINGQAAYNLEIMDVDQVEEIQTLGSSIYLMQQGNATLSPNTLVHQNKIERSNVNAIDEMVKMIETARSFESGQKVITALDNILGRTVNDIGRIR